MAASEAPACTSVGGRWSDADGVFADDAPQELGFYKERADVDWRTSRRRQVLQALVGGSADVVSGYYDHTIQMAAEGRELVAFVTMLRYPGLVLVSPPQAAPTLGGIDSLKGGIVGVTSPGSSSQMFLTYLLTRAGVPADAVSVTAIGAGASAVAAVESGRINAAWLADPAFTVVKKRNPGIRVLADLRTRGYQTRVRRRRLSRRRAVHER